MVTGLDFPSLQSGPRQKSSLGRFLNTLSYPRIINNPVQQSGVIGFSIHSAEGKFFRSALAQRCVSGETPQKRLLNDLDSNINTDPNHLHLESTPSNSLKNLYNSESIQSNKSYKKVLMRRAYEQSVECPEKHDGLCVYRYRKSSESLRVKAYEYQLGIKRPHSPISLPGIGEAFGGVILGNSFIIRFIFRPKSISYIFHPVKTFVSILPHQFLFSRG